MILTNGVQDCKREEVLYAPSVSIIWYYIPSSPIMLRKSLGIEGDLFQSSVGS